MLAHGVDRFLERLALKALLHRLPFSVTGLFGELWRWCRDVRTRFLHLFICGVYPFLQIEFTLLVHLLLLVNALGNSHLFLTCSGGGGGVILVCFSSTTCLTVVFSCGMAPAPYFRRRTVRNHSLLFFTFVLYYIYFILPLLLFVIVCRACPSLIVTPPGGGDGFLFRPLRIPFLSWAALESFCYGIGFGRLGRRPLFIILCI